MEATTKKTKGGKILTGKVVSNKMQKTVVVETSRYIKHSKYNKYLNIIKRYKAHDEGTHAVGDTVKIQECRPISKDKHFVVILESKLKANS